MTLHLSNSLALINTSSNSVMRSFPLDHHVKVLVPRAKSMVIVHPTPQVKGSASIAVLTLASPRAVSEAAAIIDLAQLARESSSRRTHFRRQQTSTYSTGSIPPLNVPAMKPAGPLAPSSAAEPKVRQAWVLHQDLVETLRLSPGNREAARTLMRKAAVDESDESLTALAGELADFAGAAGDDPDKFQHVARRASEISALLIGVSNEDLQGLEQIESNTKTIADSSETGLFDQINLDVERQSPVSRAQRGSGPLATTVDELSSLGLGADVQGRLLHGCQCVLIGTAVLNTRADRGTIAAGLTAINTGRVESQGDVDVIRYQGKPATVGLYPGAILVRMTGPPAANTPTGNDGSPSDRDLAVSYGKLTYWGRVFGNKKLVVLVAKGREHKFMAIYLRFPKKAGGFLGRLAREWGTLPASYAFQALPPPTMAEAVMTFEARLLGVAARRQANDPAAVTGAAGEVVVSYACYWLC